MRKQNFCKNLDFQAWGAAIRVLRVGNCNIDMRTNMESLSKAKVEREQLEEEEAQQALKPTTEATQRLVSRDTITEQVEQELRGVRSDEQMKKLGNALRQVVKKEELKIRLKEEIAEGVISTRIIEVHCQPEWKHKTRLKDLTQQRKGENKKVSFYGQEVATAIAIDTSGQPRSIDEPVVTEQQQEQNLADTSIKPVPETGTEPATEEEVHANAKPKSEAQAACIIEIDTSGKLQ
jgi:hypothetical protein